MRNEDFARALLGQATGWGAAFRGWPGNQEEAGTKWKGRSINGTWPASLSDPEANTFIAIGSVRDPAGRKDEANFAALHAVILDDVGTKIPRAAVTLTPTAIVRTSGTEESPNCQYWYFLERPLADLAQAKRLTDALVNKGFSDRGAKGVLRYARLPVGSNTKPAYPEPFAHELLHWEPELRYSAERLAAAFGLDLAPQNGTPGSTGANEYRDDTAELVRRVITGENYHDASRDLAARMVVQGCAGGFAVNLIRGLMDGAPDRNSPRWRERHEDVPRLVLDAEEKYRRTRQTPPEVSDDDLLVDLSNLSPDITRLPDDKIDRLLPARAVTLLAGHGGTGKTLLVEQMVPSLAAGRPFLGHEVKRSRVIFYSAEDGEEIIRHRLALIGARLGIEPDDWRDRVRIYDMTKVDPVLYREERQGGGPTARYDWLRERVAEFGADVVIIDNASDVYDANEISRPRVREFLRLLMQLVAAQRGAVLLLSHVDKNTAKAGGGTDEGYSGSTAWNNSVRSRLFLAEQNGLVTLSHKKANYGPKAEPVTLQWSDGVLLPISEAEPAAPLIRYQRLRAVLRLIGDFNQRDEPISTSPQAPNNAFRALEKERSFPRGLDRPTLYQMLRDAEREKLLERELYKNRARGEKERWVLTEKGRVECHAYAPGLDESNAQEATTCQSAES